MEKEIRAPRGSKLTCKNWQIEAAYRMIQHNLEPDNAEKPEELIVYGGTGKAARNWESYYAILDSLKKLEPDQTLLVQSGKPVGVLNTHTDAPRVLIANSNLVGNWATWDYFHELDKKGLIMYGQMTAGSWIYIGTQGILQGTFECFAEIARQKYNGTLKGKLVLTAGLGGMGGAQPLAATFNEAVSINAEVDPERIQKRLDTKYVDIAVFKDSSIKFAYDSSKMDGNKITAIYGTPCDIEIDKNAAALDICLTIADYAVKNEIPVSIGIEGNAAQILPDILEKGIIPDIVTDQTSAHDELDGYVPHQISYEEALKLRKENPKKYKELSYESMVRHCKTMVEFQRKGSEVFDYGNNLRGQALKAGYKEAFEYPGFVPAYIRPQFCEGRGPFRWVALSGDPEDIRVTDEELLKLFPEDESLHRWIKMAQKRVKFQGLPSRICWLGYRERDKAGVLFNNLVKEGKVKAPIVIGRDHLDSGSVASPNRETEAMKDGSDAIADWPILNALVNAVSGATWVSFHHGGGVGIGYSLHAGQVIVADGTDEAEARLRRVLTNDPGMGVIRHVDAGYEKAEKIAKERGVIIPMMKDEKYRKKSERK